jgi:hypothetical protein
VEEILKSGDSYGAATSLRLTDFQLNPDPVSAHGLRFIIFWVSKSRQFKTTVMLGGSSDVSVLKAAGARASRPQKLFLIDATERPEAHAPINS